jgi:hypothetical protein
VCVRACAGCVRACTCRVWFDAVFNRSLFIVWVCGCVGVWVCGCVGVWMSPNLLSISFAIACGIRPLHPTPLSHLLYLAAYDPSTPPPYLIDMDA